MKTREQAAQARAEAGTKPAHRPTQRRAFADPEDGPRGTVFGTMAAREPATQLRADGEATGPGVVGVASTTETPYEMYDMFGPYTEIVSATAFDVTLATSPLVEFTLNHNRGGGAPMAHTRNGTLVIGLDENGDFTYDASVDGSRHDVGDMLKALDRGDLAESSFKFSIDAGRWNDAFDTYTIMQVDLDRGDVSSVNFGANPTTTAGIRSLIGRLQIGRALDAEDVNMLTQAMAWFTAVDSIVDEAQESLATYLKVPSPDPDDVAELAAAKLAQIRADSQIRPDIRTIPGL